MFDRQKFLLIRNDSLRNWICLWTYVSRTVTNTSTFEFVCYNLLFLPERWGGCSTTTGEMSKVVTVRVVQTVLPTCLVLLVLINSRPKCTGQRFPLGVALIYDTELYN